MRESERDGAMPERERERVGGMEQCETERERERVGGCGA